MLNSKKSPLTDEQKRMLKIAGRFAKRNAELLRRLGDYDGPTASAVGVVTGFSPQTLADLGGVPENT